MDVLNKKGIKSSVMSALQSITLLNYMSHLMGKLHLA